MVLNNYLQDEDFLKELDLYPHTVKYAKIIALTNNERPLQEIQGKVTSGSVNIDGTAKVRRTCSLTLVTQSIDINDFYWGLNTKFRLEIGLENVINQDYPSIVWFPQGTYVITSFSDSISTSQHSISISGKDKMCLLDGEVGGHVTALSVDFGTEDFTDASGKVTNTPRLIKNIIRDAVHEYAFEPMENIIINDLDDYGIELMEYRGKTPLYMYIQYPADECTQVTLNDKTTVYAIGEDGAKHAVSLKDFGETYTFNPLNNLGIDVTPTLITMSEDSDIKYTIAKVEYGQTPGYRLTDITYAGDLILSAGNAVTNMLDKLVSMLGGFEYFYDVYGRFIFQRKKIYIQSSFNNLKEDGYHVYADSASDYSSTIYSLEGNQLISSFSNSPDLLNLKNDYSIWGTRRGIKKKDIPVHIRYAIDKKPSVYYSIGGTVYATKEVAPTIKVDKYAQFKHRHIAKCLQNDPNWWNLEDWVELWYRATGKIPSQNYEEKGELMFYNNAEGKEPIFDLLGDEYFEDIRTTKSPLHGRRHFLIDVNDKDQFDDYSIDLTQQTSGPTGEGTLINITYEMLIWRHEEHGKRNYYIYNPKIPPLENVFDPSLVSGVVATDWREIIYQMMRDYRHYYYINDDDAYAVDNAVTTREGFGALVQKLNGYKEDGEWRYPKGVTGYEQYYTDIEGFWRQLYCPKWDFKSIVLTKGDFDKALKSEDCNIFMRFFDYDNCIYRNVNINKNSGYNDFKKQSNEQEITSLAKGNALIPGAVYWYYDDKKAPIYFLAISHRKYREIKFEYQSLTTYYTRGEDNPWADEVISNPEKLNFWFDFMDSDAPMSKYAVYAIGDRTKTVNDKDIKSIYFRTTPTVVFYNPNTSETLDRKSGYTYIQCPAYMESLFQMSSQGKSAQNVLDTNLYNYSYCTESVNITAVPIYYLEPNNRIAIKDENTKADGEYIVSRISLPLTYNGTMQITATKAAVRLY